MRIVYSVDSYHPMTNGIITCVDASIRYLVERGHEVMLMVPSYPDMKDEDGPLVGIAKVVRLPSWPIWFTTNKHEKLVNPLTYGVARKYLDEFKPDLLHAHMELPSGFFLRHYALKNNIPMVATAHTYLLPYMKIYVPWIPSFFWNWSVPASARQFYDPLDLVFTPTKEMKKILEDDYKIKAPVDVLTIGIDPFDFQNLDKEEEIKNSKYFEIYPRIKDRKRLLYVGRISEEKNVSFLFKVLKKLLEKREDLELLMVGTSSWIDKYKKDIKEMGIFDHVTFMGKIEHSVIKEVYAIADVFTFASVTETQGLVTTEAIYCGIPAVAVDALGSSTVLENNKGGFLVPEDIDEFANKVELLLNDPILYQEKVKEAKERGEELTFNKTGEGLIKGYEKVLLNRKNLK